MKIITIVALLFGFVATPVLAADNTGKFYMGADYGWVTLTDTNPGGTDFPNPSSLRFSGGYHFSPMFAAEVGYAIIGDSTLSTPSGDATLKNSAFQVSAVGSFPVSSSFDLIGKVGLSFNSNKASGTGAYSGIDTSNSKTSLMFGLGAQYNVSEQFGIRAQYEDFGKTTISSNLSGSSWDSGIKQFSVGVVYNF
jgi:OmpA-OmpF porin, OOP family